MASEARITAEDQTPVLVRMAAPESERLFETLFSRYPHDEWATFARFGWRETPYGLVLTLARLDEPVADDLDDRAGHVVIKEPYSLRTALGAETHRLAVGVIHSHPQGYLTFPSQTDDDMDGYYSRYFGGFAPGRPYVSLILARDGGRLSATGRVYWEGRWHAVRRFAIEGEHASVGGYDPPSLLSRRGRARVARLGSSFGEEAAERLAGSTVAVFGAGGTGSPAVEALARAGVGHIIVVDPDTFSESNAERVHGSVDADIGTGVLKAEIAWRHVRAINPACRVTAIRGALPQREVVDAVCWADAVLGCTDQQHSRLAISDLAFRFLVPAIDCGVCLEGGSGRVTGQVLQLARFRPQDPCALCQRMIVQWRLDQELLSEPEREQRRRAARAAEARGEAPNPYWREMPQLNTVGYLTTAAGALAAGYAIGWLTGRFAPPFAVIQLNLAAPCFEAVEAGWEPEADCSCRRARGHADQGRADALIAAPEHWPPPEVLHLGFDRPGSLG